jgi:hypothetical protein
VRREVEVGGATWSPEAGGERLVEGEGKERGNPGTEPIQDHTRGHPIDCLYTPAHHRGLLQKKKFEG